MVENLIRKEGEATLVTVGTEAEANLTPAATTATAIAAGIVAMENSAYQTTNKAGTKSTKKKKRNINNRKQ
jgi:hypothetical protein